MYQCEICTLQTKRKHNLKIHMLRKHKNQYIRENEMCSDRIPVIVDQTLNTQVGYGALAPSVQNESNNNNNTVTNEDYEKVADIEKAWKRECDKVQQDWKVIDNELYNR